VTIFRGMGGATRAGCEHFRLWQVEFSQVVDRTIMRWPIVGLTRPSVRSAGTLYKLQNFRDSLVTRAGGPPGLRFLKFRRNVYLVGREWPRPPLSSVLGTVRATFCRRFDPTNHPCTARGGLSPALATVIRYIPNFNQIVRFAIADCSQGQQSLNEGKRCNESCDRALPANTV
jgi:hypothetical protein